MRIGFLNRLDQEGKRSEIIKMLPKVSVLQSEVSLMKDDLNLAQKIIAERCKKREVPKSCLMKNNNNMGIKMKIKGTKLDFHYLK